MWGKREQDGKPKKGASHPVGRNSACAAPVEGAVLAPDDVDVEGIIRRSMQTGRISGASRASTGTTISAKPIPIVPCTKAATATLIAARQRAASAGNRDQRSTLVGLIGRVGRLSGHACGQVGILSMADRTCGRASRLA